jgi:nitroimidazol reductase NimA-like FMN-containing flavoprotein (pyridoxamine 5'-phosphate oxidase superfamily)
MGGGTYLEVLTREECLRLLPTVPVGWIAYCAYRPQLVPVNFVVHGDEIVVRTGYGSKLAAAAHNLMMSFGVLQTDPLHRTGWSVTVTGRARLVSDRHDDLTDLELGLSEVWAPGEKTSLISIGMREVSGRRILAAGEAPAAR